jgi:uncharacterized surface protein with fasciclin (FAS1) repeats
MIRFTKLTAAAAAVFAFTASAGLAANPMVGGAPMFANKNIVQNAVNSADHTTLVAAVKAAGLVDTLEGSGPFTVFAPNNKAFAALPAGTVDSLLEPQNKSTLTSVLTYHVVPGTLTAEDIKAKVAEMGGSYMVKTVQGEDLTFKVDQGTVFVADAKGDIARVTIPDVMQSNGVIHGIDTVLMP